MIKRKQLIQPKKYVLLPVPAVFIVDQDAINKVLSSSSQVAYDSDLDELNSYYTKFQQTLMAEQICRQLKIKMKPIIIFDIAHYPAGFQLAIDKTAVEKAKMFRSLMSDKGIDL